MAKESKQEHKLVISAVDQTKATFKNVQSSLNQVKGTVDGVKGKLAGLGVALSTASFSSMVKGAIEANAELKKFQVQTGLSAEAITAINYATGGNLEPVAKGMTKLAKAAYEARNGGAAAKETFAALGITFQKADGSLKSAEELFTDTAKAISRMPNELDRLALAEKIYGKGADEILPLLMKSKDGFGALSVEARKYGVVLSQDVIDSSAKFVKETRKISKMLDSGAQIWAAKLAPGLSIIATAIQETIQAQSDLQSKGKALEGDGALSNWASTAITMITGVIDVFDLLKRVFQVVGSYIGVGIAAWVVTISGIASALANIGSGIGKALTGDFAGAKAAFSNGFNDIKNIGKNYLNTFKEVGKSISDVVDSPRLSAGFKAAGDKALAAHNKVLDEAVAKKAGYLTEEQKFTNKMLDLQKKLAKGMQDSMAKQIEAIDKVEKKLKDARERKSNTKDDFAKARDELGFGSVASGSADPRKDIEKAIAAADKARAAGKYDIADSEAKKVISLLNAAKAAGPQNEKDRIAAQEEIAKELKALEEEYKQVDATIDHNFGNTSDTRFGDSSANDAKKEKLSQITNQANALKQKSNNVNSGSQSNGLKDYETDDYLKQAEAVAQKSADESVATYEKQAKDANAKLDELYAKILKLKDVDLSFKVNNDKAIKTVEDMMALLQAKINEKPLVLTAVNAPTMTDAQKKAYDLTPDEYKTRNDSEFATPRLPNVPDVNNKTSSSVLKDIDTEQKVPAVFNYPNFASVNADINKSAVTLINQEIQRNRMKAGDQ